MSTAGPYIYRMDQPVPEPPARVVSLVPSLTEALFDLGVGGRLVGVTHFCTRPAEGVAGVERIGGTKNPDIARIIGLRPDLVIANQEENRREDVEALTDAGIAVWVTYPRTVREALNVLWNIMHIFDYTAMVPRVRAIEQAVDWVEGVSLNAVGPPPRVFMPIWHRPLMTVGSDTYAYDLLRICGAQPIFADRPQRYPIVTLAEVEAAAPDIILLPDEPFRFSEAHVAEFAHLDVPAARMGRIRLVDGSLVTWHGTRLAHALNLVPNLLSAE